MPKIALPLSLVAVVLLCMTAEPGLHPSLYWYGRFAGVWAGWELWREAKATDPKGLGYGVAFYVALIPFVGFGAGWFQTKDLFWVNFLLVAAISIIALPQLFLHRPSKPTTGEGWGELSEDENPLV